MPKFGPSIKSLLTNKYKLYELARTLLNEHCSAVLLKKLPEKLGDPGKFLIPCDFPRMVECLALFDLGAGINLMPLSMWNKLPLLDLSPTCMTLELADRLISRPVGVAEDVFVKVGTFHFLADFVVVDFDADPRVPLILGRYFLKIKRALIDVFEGELTLCVGKEAITFNLDQTSRYSANYSDMMAKRINIINMACEEYSQEVLGFLIDFLLKEVDGFLALEDDPTSPEVDQSYIDSEGDIILLEAFLNDDPSLPPPNQGNYLPKVRKELKIYEAKSDKSSIDEPPEVELKHISPHLEYAFLEGDDKLPVIIVKDLNWDMPFELMCDASDFSIGVVLGQRQDKHFRSIHYASKTMTEAESNYTTTEKEMLAVVYAFEKFRSYLIMNKSIVYTDHSALKYLFAKKDSKARLLRWVLLLQEFTFKTAGDHRKVQLNELNKLRDQAYENSLIYKEKTKRLYDSKIKDCVFNIGDIVLLFNSRLKIFSGKLKSCWSGPFTISHVYPYGTVELSQPNGPNFKVNGHRLKHYLGEDVPKMVVSDLQTFPKDH
nr:reverse transcriptase domain-containing protein [Tanacetum cinerariifolium]